VLNQDGKECNLDTVKQIFMDEGLEVGSEWAQH
jgi:hypothetical protein